MLELENRIGRSTSSRRYDLNAETRTRSAPSRAAGAARARAPAQVVILFVILLVAAGGATPPGCTIRDRVSSDDAQVDGHITAIAPKITGNVIEVPVLDNQPVKAGQVLVRIDPRDYQAKVDMAKAAAGSQAESQCACRPGGGAAGPPKPRNPAPPAPPPRWPTPQAEVERARAVLRAGLRLRSRRTPRPTCGPNRPATTAPRPTWRA